MKTILTTLALTLLASAAHAARTVDCIAEDQTIIQATIVEHYMMGELVDITVQKVGQPLVKFNENVHGTAYSVMTTQGGKLDIYHVNQGPANNTMIYGVNNNVLTDHETGKTQKVVCTEEFN